MGDRKAGLIHYIFPPSPVSAQAKGGGGGGGGGEGGRKGGGWDRHQKADLG